MEKTVYIDVLFVLNMTVNYLLLLASAKMVDAEHSRMRLLGAAALGGVYAALVYFPSLSVLYTVVSRLLAAALMVFTAFGFRWFFRLFLTFFVTAFAFGGAVLAAQGLFSGVDVRNGVVYIDMTLLNVIFVSAVVYLLIELLFHRAASGRGDVRTAKAVIKNGGKALEASVLIDTGCTLSDPISGKRVILIGFSDFTGLLPADEAEIIKALRREPPSMQLQALAGCRQSSRFRLLPYSTIDRGGLLLAYRPDSVEVEGAPKAACLVACSISELNDPRRYRAVLGV